MTVPLQCINYLNTIILQNLQIVHWNHSFFYMILHLYKWKNIRHQQLQLLKKILLVRNISPITDVFYDTNMFTINRSKTFLPVRLIWYVNPVLFTWLFPVLFMKSIPYCLTSSFLATVDNILWPRSYWKCSAWIEYPVGKYLKVVCFFNLPILKVIL